MAAAKDAVYIWKRTKVEVATKKNAGSVALQTTTRAGCSKMPSRRRYVTQQPYLGPRATAMTHGIMPHLRHHATASCYSHYSWHHATATTHVLIRQPLLMASCYSQYSWPHATANTHGLMLQPIYMASDYSHYSWPHATANTHGLMLQPLHMASCYSQYVWPHPPYSSIHASIGYLCSQAIVLMLQPLHMPVSGISVVRLWSSRYSHYICMPVAGISVVRLWSSCYSHYTCQYQVSL